MTQSVEQMEHIMSTRRDFLKTLGNTTAGVLIASRSAGLAAQAGRREVSVGGRRVTVVDIHAHCVFSEAAELISGTPLDASTKDSIRAVLQSAGHDVEVQFMDSGAHNGERHVRVIKKQVVTE